MTWGFDDGTVTRYLTQDLASLWCLRKLDWRSQSLQNLARRSDPVFSTGLFERHDGRPGRLALIFMHADAYGPSRLLFETQLRQSFPQGCLVALPEMSCGFAIASDASAQDRKQIEETVDACYRNGTRPLVPGIHDPALLLPQ